MKIETIGPISFMALGIVAAIIGAVLEQSIGLDPSGVYIGGTIAFLVGLYLVIDRKRSKNIFKFAS